MSGERALLLALLNDSLECLDTRPTHHKKTNPMHSLVLVKKELFWLERPRTGNPMASARDVCDEAGCNYTRVLEIHKDRIQAAKEFVERRR